MKKSFTARLRGLRGDRSQQEFAHLIGVRQNTYSLWETGSSEPSYSAIKQICEACGVSADDLLGIAIEKPSGITSRDGHVTIGSGNTVSGNLSRNDCSNCEILKAAVNMMKQKKMGRKATNHLLADPDELKKRKRS